MYQKRNVLQAKNPYRYGTSLLPKSIKGAVWVGCARRQATDESPSYPEVPAQYPNRAVRKIMLRGRIDLLPQPWREFLIAMQGRAWAQRCAPLLRPVPA